jgi:hypothetical protein
MAEVSFRPAQLGDAADIHTLLLTLAPTIPLLVDTLEREEALYALVRDCARAGESWVACDEAGRIVGFVLAKPVEYGRHYAEHEVLELRYAGVGTGSRDSDVLAQLVSKLLDRMVPVVATVSSHNRSGLALSLEEVGFEPGDAAGGERDYRWDPGRKG